MQLEIAYEDNDILICKKKAGVPVETKSLQSRDLVSIVRTYLSEKNGNSYIALINRLDQPVEGLVLFAKTKSMAKELTKQLTAHSIQKSYMAVVTGKPKQTGVLIDYLVKDARKNMPFVANKQVSGAKRAELSYEVIQNTEDMSLLKISLKTGRHHQIRVQFAHMGTPLWGDTKYNEQFLNQRGVFAALCASELCFYHPKTKNKLHVTCEPAGEIFHKF